MVTGNADPNRLSKMISGSSHQHRIEGVRNVYHFHAVIASTAVSMITRDGKWPDNSIKATDADGVAWVTYVNNLQAKITKCDVSVVARKRDVSEIVCEIKCPHEHGVAWVADVQLKPLDM